MKKIISIFFLLLFLNNCGNFEFVYLIDKNLKMLTDFTDIKVSGDDSAKVYVSLKEAIGDNEEDNFNYKLLVNSIKEESAQVINKDATASKFKTQYLISYSLYNTEKECIVFFEEIKTINTYNAKSEGYSFGTDLSRDESNMQNINENINKFLAKLNNAAKINSCIS